MLASRSSTATESPVSASAIAAESPLGPDPTTKASVSGRSSVFTAV